MTAWIGVDLDGTLAFYDESRPYEPQHIGEPVRPMVDWVKHQIEEGYTIKIFTARVAPPIEQVERREIIDAIQNWTWTHFGKPLPVTHCKDRDCVLIVDDIALGVHHNTGRFKAL